MNFFKLLILLNLVSASAFASWGKHESVNMRITPEHRLINKLLTEVWKEDALYFIDVPSQQLLNEDGMTVRTDGGLVQPAGEWGEGTPLLSFVPVGENQIKVTWDLSKLEALIMGEVRFVKEFGPFKFNHSEDFSIKVNGINHATSIVQVNFNNGAFQVEVIDNQGFEFNNIQITILDGTSSVFQRILNSVFSKQEVDAFIQRAINSQLKNYINNKVIVGQIQNAVNEQLAKLTTLKVKVSEYASNMTVEVSKFNLSPSSLDISLVTEFNSAGQKVHACAERFTVPYRDNFKLMDDTAETSHRFIEQVIYNFSTYERYENGKLQEPLFCFGYKDYDRNGNPIGENDTIRYLGFNIDYKFWARPISQAVYTYDPTRNLIHAEVNIEVDSEVEGRTKNTIQATARVTLKIKHIPGKGIIMSFVKLDLPVISGNIITSPINIPASAIKGILVDHLNKRARQDYAEVQIIEDEVEFFAGIKLKVEGIDMKSNTHSVKFRAK